MPAWLIPAALTAGSFALDKVFGGHNKPIIPKDIQGLRGDTIALLHALLQPGAFNQGGVGNNFFFGGRAGGVSPERQTLDTARPILEGMLTGTGPQFERDIAVANSQGGRFGSANAILRGEALRNLYNTRNQTAQTLGMLSGAAGQREFDTQSQLAQLMAGLLGLSGQATLSPPIAAGGGGDMASLLGLFAALGGSGMFGGGKAT